MFAFYVFTYTCIAKSRTRDYTGLAFIGLGDFSDYKPRPTFNYSDYPEQDRVYSMIFRPLYRIATALGFQEAEYVPTPEDWDPEAVEAALKWLREHQEKTGYWNAP